MKEKYMSELSFFQRYSKRENQITNNVFFMLRLLYQENPTKLQTVLDGVLDNSNIEDIEFKVGPVFEQQTVGSDSIPDAIIHQRPFLLMVEVKTGSKWNKFQIKSHLKSAKSVNEKNSILLLLSKAKEPEFDTELIAKAKKSNTKLAHISFEQLIDLIDTEEVVAPHETNLESIVEDFKEYLWEEDLLDDPYEMFAFGCSQTLDWNLKNKIYYDRVSRPNKVNVLTGFYAAKEIHAIGQVACTLIGSPKTGWEVETAHKTKSNKEVIRDLKKKAKDIPHELGDESLRWYVYDDIHQTSFKKETPRGYFQGVWIHLEEFVDEDIEPTDLAKVAEDLKGKSFGQDRGY